MGTGFTLAFMICIYLVFCNAVSGPGGDKEAFEQGRQNVHEFIEYVKGNEAGTELIREEGDVR